MKKCISKQLYNKRILVTGGFGFIGSNVISRLFKYKCKVYILEQKGVSPWRLKDSLNKIHVKMGNITNRNFVRKIVFDIRPQIVLHLAGNISHKENISTVRKMLTTNLLGTLNLFEVCAKIDLERIVTLGTVEEYGRKKVPFSEINRENPVTPYSLSKIGITYLSQLMWNIFQLPVVILRPTVTYGPLQKGSMLIPSVIENLLKGKKIKLTRGEQTRDFLYIDDLVEAIISTMAISRINGEIINVGSGKKISIRKVAMLIATMLNKKDLLLLGAKGYRTKEIMHYACKLSKAKNLLGWQAKVSLKEGLKKTILWFQKQN